MYESYGVCFHIQCSIVSQSNIIYVYYHTLKNIQNYNKIFCKNWCFLFLAFVAFVKPTTHTTHTFLLNSFSFLQMKVVYFLRNNREICSRESLYCLNICETMNKIIVKRKEMVWKRGIHQRNMLLLRFFARDRAQLFCSMLKISVFCTDFAMFYKSFLFKSLIYPINLNFSLSKTMKGY